jgi:hypothetical protein
MTDKLQIQREGRGRYTLTVRRVQRIDTMGHAYELTTNGGDALTVGEVDQIAAFIGDDEAGAGLLAKLRGKLS